MKHVRNICLLVLAALCAQGCESPEDARASAFTLGTYIELKSHERGAQGALDAALAEIERIDGVMDFAKSGDIGAINAGAGSFVPVSAETFELIKTALYIHDISGGAYNPIVLPIMRLWGLEHGASAQRVPDEAEIRAALPLLDVSRIALDADACAVRVGEGMALDLGGIAKGYAGQRARDMVGQSGVKSALLMLGGNIVAVGRRSDGQAYRIGIRHPRAEGEVLITLNASDKAVVTSGDYERFFESGGRRYHHIIDPATGAPAQSGLISVTIIADSSTLADGLSTALFVMGAHKGLELAESLDGVEAVLVDDNARVYATSGARALITIHDDAYALQ